MSANFSIGEIAKIFNISTQTLRLYDRINLLKPSYINNETGYRYYSIGQFVNLECIKRCKAMGFSLDEIKELIHNDSSIDSTLELIKKQKLYINEKMQELRLMEEQLNNVEDKIQGSVRLPFNKIYFTYNDERVFKKFKENIVTLEETEIASREVILALEEKNTVLKYDISFIVPYKSVINNHENISKSILVQQSNNKDSKEKNLVKMPAGRYLTMYFDDSNIDNRKYYNQMLNYIKVNNIQVYGDFLETTIVLRVNKDGNENTLAKLEILCK